MCTVYKLTVTSNTTPSLYTMVVLNLNVFTSCGLCLAIIMDIIQMELWELLLFLHSYYTYVNIAVFYKLLLLRVTGSC